MAITEKALRRATEDATHTKNKRDRLIRRASEQGMTRRQVARATGLSVTRIQQIVSEKV
jgi:hypothetical protein